MASGSLLVRPLALKAWLYNKRLIPPIPDLDVSQSIGGQAGLATAGDWPAAITKTLARFVIIYYT